MSSLNIFKLFYIPPFIPSVIPVMCILRKVVVTVCCAVLTLATGLTASAQSYWHLVILRMLMGAG